MKFLKLFLILFFIFFTGRSFAQVIAGAFSIGINQAFDRANQLVQQAEQSGLILEVNAASQAITVIDNAKLAYESELKSTAQVLSSQQQQLISSINGVLDNIQNHILRSCLKTINK